MNDTNEISLNTRTIRAGIQYLKKKRVILIMGTVLGLAFGIFYSTVKRPLYTGTVSFSVEGDENSGGGSLLSLAAQFGLDMGGGASGVFEGDNILTLFTSRKMIEAALLQPYYDKKISYADKFLDVTRWRNGNNIPVSMYPFNSNKPFTREQDSIMGAMYEYISKGLLSAEKPDIKLNIYTVSFRSFDEQFTKSFLEILVSQVSLFYVTTKTNRAKYNVDILQKRTDSIRNAFDKALYGRAGILDANLNPAFQTPTVDAEKEQTNITVLGTAYGELLKNLELAKYTLLKQIPYIQVIDEPHYPLEEKTYPYWLYVPLSVIGFFCLFTGILIGFRVLRKLYELYFRE